MNMNDIPPIERLSRDLALAAKTMTDQEARYLVDAYYMMQDDRKRAHNQVRALGESEEPNALLGWLAAQSETLEAQIKRALDKYTDAHPMGSWMREIHGIGPVLSAGLLAHINMEPWVCANPSNKKRSEVKCAPATPCSASCRKQRLETVGHLWRFAGLDPTIEWRKGERRPFNAKLKTLCWKVGQSFMKFSNDEKCFYGHIYRERKAYEIARNEAGGNADAAAIGAARVGKDTDAYKHYSEGRLPPAQIDARARRYAVKLFLSHLHNEWYRRKFHAEPPLPYAIGILGHAHMIHPPVRGQ